MNNRIKSNIDEQSIYSLMEFKNVGEIVTYQQIEAVCRKKDLIKNSTHRALKKLLDNGVAYHNVRLIGYKRANSSEIVSKSPNFIRSAKRKLSVSIKTLDLANDTELNRDEINKKNTYYAVAGAMYYLAQPKQIKSIEQKAITGELTFNPKESLKFLSNS